MQATKPSATDSLLERRFPAPRQAVFDALTRGKHLLRWLRTEEMALVSCEGEPRGGASVRLVFRRQRGPAIAVLDAYSFVDPPRELRYTETYDFSPLKIQVTTELAEAAGGTLLRHLLHYSSAQERDADFPGVVSSLTEAYSRLERYLAAGGATNGLAVARSIRIAAPRSAVWQVLTDVRSVKLWLGTDLVSGWKVGDPILFRFSWNGKAFEDKGVIRQFDPERAFAYSYWSGLSGLPDQPQNYSLVTFLMGTEGDGTVLDLRHEQIVTPTMQEHSDRNWAETLIVIKSLAEGR